MTALQCEICGGKLMAKSGGLFECEYCGMQYNKLRIKEMVQEIKGSVKVEGTVEVTGTVKVAGGVNVTSLLKRAWLSIEDRQFRAAQDCFEQVLNIEPELGEAYFGLAMAMDAATTPEEFASRRSLKSQRYLERARKCSDAKCRELLNRYDVAKAQMFVAEQAAKEIRVKRIPLLEARRTEIAPATCLIRFYGDQPFVLTQEGQIRKLTDSPFNNAFVQEAQELKYIRKFEVIYNSVLLLDRFGNVDIMLYSKSERAAIGNQIHFKRTRLIADNTAVDICVDSRSIYILTEGGTLYATKVLHQTNRDSCPWDNDSVTHFHNVKSIVSSDSSIFAYCECTDGSRKRLSEGGMKDLPADDDCTLYNPAVRLDGTIKTTGLRILKTNDIDQAVDCISVGNVDYVLMLDGTVMYYDNSTQEEGKELWKTVAAITGYRLYGDQVYGITSDGYVVSNQSNTKFLINEPLFTDLKSLKATMFPETSLQERRAAAEALENALAREAQINKLTDIQTALQNELSTLTGFFAKKRRKEVESRLAEIQNELKGLK
jgi:hypothetical protein